MLSQLQKGSRTHDDLYLSESRHEAPKENFKFILQCAREWGFDESGALYDFGCAAGEFESYLKAQCPGAAITGVEPLPQLVEKARSLVPGVSFLVASALDSTAVSENASDCTFCIGVHSIFDDPLPLFENLLHWTKASGLVMIFGLFNHYPLDVWQRVRKPGHAPDHREVGWNMISQATVSAFLEAHPAVSEHRFVPFSIKIDIPPNADPLRSWTEKMESGERLIVNGSGLLHDLNVLQIRRSASA